MSAIAINHNLLASNTANNLTTHYGRLSTSTERLSTGLRINSAADDAAGLAIRELMRADVAALQQGMRNVNDAISMIQTFDGALGIIDEKLIRMKELAEQAATGTYDSTQRLMIDSEFQAMGSEIDRIARATDFNGIKLIDGKNAVNGEANGTITLNDGIAVQAEVTVGDKKYDVSGGTGKVICAQLNASATQDGNWDLSGIQHPDKLAAGTTNITITNNGTIKFGDKYLLVTPMGFPSVKGGATLTMEYDPGKYAASFGWNVTLDGNRTQIQAGTNNLCMFSDGTQSYVINVNNPSDPANSFLTGPTGPTTWTAPPNDTTFTSSMGTATGTMNGNSLEMTIDLGNGNSISNSWNITNGNGLAVSEATVSFTIKDTTPKPVTPNPPGPGGPTGPTGPTDPDNPLAPNYKIPDNVIRVQFGASAANGEDFYDIYRYDATTKGLGLHNPKTGATTNGINLLADDDDTEMIDIKTQDNAQEALVRLNDAIVQKDKIRANYGALQNRFENTLTNLTIQSENIQNAESRLSDADIAREMTEFVRNQVLTNAAVAMLSQANSLPQMVMRLIK